MRRRKRMYLPDLITELEQEDRMLVRKGYHVEKMWTKPRPDSRKDEDDLPFEMPSLKRRPLGFAPDEPVRHIWLDEDLKDDPDWMDDDPTLRLDDMIICLDEQIARLEEEEKKKIRYDLELIDVEQKDRPLVRRVLYKETSLSLHEINEMLRNLPATIACTDEEEAEELLAELEEAGALVIRSYCDGNTKTLEELKEENNFEAAFKAYVKNCKKEKLAELMKVLEAEEKHREKEEAARRVWVYSAEGNEEEIAQILHENARYDLDQARSFVKNLPTYFPCYTKEFAAFLCRRINEAGGIAETGSY